MTPIPKASFQTPEQLAARIKERDMEASLLPPGPVRRSILIEIAQLRAYEDVMRWLSSSA